MADWNQPTNASLYIDTLNLLKSRDVDAFTMAESPTNVPEGAIRYNRSLNKFQESLSSVWTDKLLALAGGGTGAATASGARTNLGLGSIATQAASSVSITGGTIAGTTISNTNNINAAALTSGTIPEARFPAAWSNSYEVTGLFRFLATGVNGLRIQSTDPVLNFNDSDGAANAKYTRLLVNSTAFHIQTLDDAYGSVATIFTLTRAGVLTVNGSGITALNASNLSTGTVATARLGTGTADSTTFLRGDGTWATPGGGGSGIPSGMIAIFDTSCPSGWTRVAAFDNKFLRGAAAYGATGGADSHAHDVNGNTGNDGSHQHGVNIDSGFASGGEVGAQSGGSFTAATNSHDHNVSGTTDSGGTHSHSVNITTDTVSNIPAYINVVYCKKD